MTAFDRPGRLPEEVAHELARGPLDRSDWPTVGDEVLYRRGDTGRWVPAVVLQVAEHDGDLKLDTGEGPELAALDVKHGPHRHGWMLYDEPWCVRLDPGRCRLPDVTCCGRRTAACRFCGGKGIHTCKRPSTARTDSETKPSGGAA